MRIKSLKLNLLRIISILAILLIIFSGTTLIKHATVAEQEQAKPGYSDKGSVYTSPNGKLHAVTIQKGEELVQTYITDESGKTVAGPENGSFISWSPDNSKALLYLSAIENPKGRELYVLGTDGSYKDSGLPVGVISAAYSPDNSQIAYSVTKGGTDSSEIYTRDANGKDHLILNGDDSILTWLQWSPKGDKILYMQSDLLLRPGKQFVWMMDSDGGNKVKIDSVDWDYPAVWSPDGTSVAFANKGDIWEYGVQDKKLVQLTKQGADQPAIHPEYSADGKTITYQLQSGNSEERLSVSSSLQNYTDIENQSTNP